MNLKDVFRHLLPAFVGVGAGLGSGYLVIGMGRPLRFATMALTLLVIGYVLARLNFFNQRLDVEARARAKGLLPGRTSLKGALPRWPLEGYLAMVAVAFVVAASFAWSWQQLPCLVGAAVLWWWADDRFTRANSLALGERLEALLQKAAAASARTAAAAASAPGAAGASPAAVVRPAAKPAGLAVPSRAAMSASPAAPTATPAAGEAGTPLAALLRAVEAKRKDDPLVGAKVGASELLSRLLEGLKDERGVHTESLLCMLGALAGYACQVSLRNEALSRGDNANSAFHIVQDTQGRRYFFGDALNQRLCEGGQSVWNVATSGLRSAGQQSLPDLSPLFRHVSESVGTDQFGVPRWPEGHRAGDLPVNYVKALWPVVLPLLRQFTPRPVEWPVLFGFALQKALRLSHDVLPADMALQMIMESAVPMSKVDLQTA